MNTSQLECFVQVAKTLSFRQAAEELHLAQSTVSKNIAALENELACALFLRTTREVALTALGESFLEDAQEILRLTYAADERARRHADGTGITIAYSDSCDLLRLGPALDALRREGQVHVSLLQGSQEENLQNLERKQVDVVLGFESNVSSSEISFRKLRKDTLQCIVRSDSSLALFEEVSPESVEGLPQIFVQSVGIRRRGYRGQSDLPNTPEELLTVCSTASEAYSLIDGGFGYALVPSLYTIPDPFHKVLRWRPTVSVRYGAYCLKGRQGGTVQRFIELASHIYAIEGYGRPEPNSWAPQHAPRHSVTVQ